MLKLVATLVPVALVCAVLYPVVEFAVTSLLTVAATLQP